MRRLIISTGLLVASSAAMAADMPTKYTPAPAYVAATVYSWTGFYVGANAGYARGGVTVVDQNGGVPPGPFKYNTNGGFGGGQLGYNYQFGALVVGVEGDLSYLANSGSGIIGSAAADHHQNLTLGNGALGDVTGRLGYAAGPVLFYGKVGLAWFSGKATQATTNPGYVPTGTGQFSGWVAGAGVEYMLMPNLSLKAEYLHYDFGDRQGFQTNVGDLSSPIGFKFGNRSAPKFDTVKAGVNYHF